ncbi:hypothetical protein [Nocardiopsis alba]|uniref:deoxynucleotide monophosphate kinase family protein n=1 Tax=Nocardiopsis alba TaxID=53437 RepID=UPI003D74F80B
MSIALMGYAGSGKDTAADYLVEERGYARVAFADPVRESLLALDPIVHAEPEDYGDTYRGVRLSTLVGVCGWDRAKRVYPEVRRLLQAHGTEAVRGVIGDDVWVRLALRRISAAWAGGRRVVITDVRFPNEVTALRAHGVRLVWLDRPGVGPANDHITERSVFPEDADAVIKNDGTPDDLARRLNEFLCRL